MTSNLRTYRSTMNLAGDRKSWLQGKSQDITISGRYESLRKESSFFYTAMNCAPCLNPYPFGRCTCIDPGSNASDRSGSPAINSSASPMFDPRWVHRFFRSTLPDTYSCCKAPRFKISTELHKSVVARARARHRRASASAT